MSTSGAVHSKRSGGTVVGATSVGSRADEGGIGVREGLSSKFGSLMSGAGEGKGRAAIEEHEDTMSTRKGRKGGKTMGHEAESRQQNPKKKTPSSKKKTPSSSARPRPTASAAAAATASNVKKVNRPERRFAPYQLACISQPVHRGGGSRGGGWGRTGRGNDWLWDYLKNPRRPELEQVVYYEDELCVVIYDGFPKAQYHLLLIPKGLPVTQLTDLRREHLPSLRRLHDVGKVIAEELCRQGAGKVRCGYHAIPSVEPLHVHIVSQDFDSPDLFNRSHWNGFTTEFFMDCSWVEARVEERGRLVLDKKKYTALQRQPVRCFRCGWAASVESLKKHNLECAAPLPGGVTACHGKST